MKTWVKRALRTFAQTAIGYLVVAVPAVNWADTGALKATLIGIGTSAIAAGISAAMNYKEA